MVTAIEKSREKVNIFNLGTDEYWEVNDSINWICRYLEVDPEIHYAGGERGWIGDNPFIFLDCHKMRSLGWKPMYSIKEGLIKTLDYLQKNQWVFERR